MKLFIQVLLSMLCAWTLNECLDATEIGEEPSVFSSFPAGFPDGVHVTIFFKLKQKLKDAEGVFINFYKEMEVDVKKKQDDIYAHVVVRPAGYALYTAEISPGGSWVNQDNKLTPPDIVGPSKDLLWWRIDMYKIDDNHAAFWVQGFWSKVHEFKHKLGDIKSVYVFNNIDKENVFVKYRLPSDLVKPITLVQFNKHEETFVAEAPKTKRAATEVPKAGNLWTSHNEVKLAALPKNKRLFLTVWFASKPQNKQGDPFPWPMIQFMPVIEASKKSESKPHVFTIYHQWNADATKGRLFYVDLFTKNAEKIDTHHDQLKQECIMDGSVADIAHFRIERLDNGAIQVTSYYVGPDAKADDGIMGTTCTTKAEIIQKMNDPAASYHDSPIEIKGLNGATILHADASWL